MSWGYSPRVEAYLGAAAFSAGSEVDAARVVTRHRGVVEVVRYPSGDLATIELARPHAAADDEMWPPVVGDWVALTEDLTVAAVLPRASYLERGSVSGRSLMQPIAANIDVLLIVEAVSPPPAIGWIERLLALAIQAGIPAWGVLTKTDLADAAEVNRIREQVAPRVERLFLTTTTDASSFDELFAALDPDMTLALLGHSGTGKTTLTNLLVGAALATGEVRERDGKGRHTTTRRQLLAGPHALVLDTPGIRQLAAVTDTEAVSGTFPEIQALTQQCRFSDCTHRNEPACAVRAAIDAGDLDPDMFWRFTKMHAESQRRAERSDERVRRAGERTRSKNNTRGRRDMMRFKGRPN